MDPNATSSSNDASRRSTSEQTPFQKQQPEIHNIFPEDVTGFGQDHHTEMPTASGLTRQSEFTGSSELVQSLSFLRPPPLANPVVANPPVAGPTVLSRPPMLAAPSMALPVVFPSTEPSSFGRPAEPARPLSFGRVSETVMLPEFTIPSTVAGPPVGNPFLQSPLNLQSPSEPTAATPLLNFPSPNWNPFAQVHSPGFNQGAINTFVPSITGPRPTPSRYQLLEAGSSSGNNSQKPPKSNPPVNSKKRFKRFLKTAEDMTAQDFVKGIRFCGTNRLMDLTRSTQKRIAD
ncbi:hypothetical protein F4861DRAFT_470680 [Xylaria intraflava]|nr:hypothetical protein F4861DRAFT_470680 [Xylaria intraflava]